MRNPWRFLILLCLDIFGRT